MPTSSSRPHLLLISYRFPPESYPLAIGLRGVIDSLREEWTIDVITAAENAYAPSGVTIHHVPGTTAIPTLHRLLARVKLQKIAHLVTWPDPFWPWIYPALRTAEHVIGERRPDVLLGFLMPFSTGYVGTMLSKKTGIPLVLNLDDSPTCLDMHPEYPCRLHYELSRRMEDHFVKQADRMVYVSERNRNRVAQRHDLNTQTKLRVVRCSASPHHGGLANQFSKSRSDDDTFRIVYTGAMNGWHAFSEPSTHPLKKLYEAWQQAGTFERVGLDRRSHSPVFLGHAIREVESRHPAWKGRIRGEIYGSTFPQTVVDRVLHSEGIEEVIHVHGRIPAHEVPNKTQNADLLFLTLPDRLSGPPGGRISLKTYEYLMTDRPILGAVPVGENRDFLEDAPGTFVTAPTDVSAMADVIEHLVSRRFSGDSLSVSRVELRERCSSERRARELSNILTEVSRVPTRLANSEEAI